MLGQQPVQLPVTPCTGRERDLDAKDYLRPEQNTRSNRCMRLYRTSVEPCLLSESVPERLQGAWAGWRAAVWQAE